MNRKDFLFSTMLGVGSITAPFTSDLLAHARTDTQSSLERMCRDRATIEIKNIVKQVVEYTMFEHNTSTLRSRLQRIISTALSELSRQEIIRDYIVQCDDFNNDSNVIDTNKLVLDIHYRVNADEDFLKLRVAVKSLSVNFEEVL